MRFLVTGHTGFKGSWLTMLLTSMGHEVCGLALDPPSESLFELARVGELCELDARVDIREMDSVAAVFDQACPDVLIHMAAQPLVPESYRRPRWTIETNVLGTLNVLEAASGLTDLRAAVVVTTDKVYRNVSRVQGYVESDSLGGEDPYSASKAMSDILTHSWAVSFPGAPIAIARAGNVIGGGDYSAERLIPDVIKAAKASRLPELRQPLAIRPWQHVLDCLTGYLELVTGLTEDTQAIKSGDAWNFGPDQDSIVTVGQVTEFALAHMGRGTDWEGFSGENFPESGLLMLDASKAGEVLGWRNRLAFRDALAWTLDWYIDVDRGVSPREVSMRQIRQFEELLT